MGTGRSHEPVAPIQARDAGTTPNNPKKRGYHSASENPIGIETTGPDRLDRLHQITAHQVKPSSSAWPYR